MLFRNTSRVHRPRLLQAAIPAFAVLTAAVMPLCGCSHQQSQAQPTIRTDGVSDLPPQTQNWLSAKVRDSGGDYNKLSRADRLSLDAMTAGHGQLLYDKAKN
jgi:hypothetical protein